VERERSVAGVWLMSGVDGGVESGDAGIRCHSVGGFVCNTEIIA